LSPRVTQVPRTGSGPSDGHEAGWLLAVALLSSLGAAGASWHHTRRWNRTF
jgi:hypothetical protein